MRFRNILLLFSLAVSVIACSTPRQQQSLAPASDSQEYVLRGFSLSIPASDGWNVVRQEPFKIILSRQGKAQQELYAIQALVVQLPEFSHDKEFLEYIESRMNSMRDTSTSEILEAKTSLVAGHGNMCVQSHSKEKKPVAAGKAENADQSILELVNFTCRYPDKKNAGIYLAYSKRYPTAVAGEDLTTEANKLFDNMNFKDL